MTELELFGDKYFYPSPTFTFFVFIGPLWQIILVTKRFHIY